MLHKFAKHVINQLDHISNAELDMRAMMKAVREHLNMDLTLITQVRGADLIFRYSDGHCSNTSTAHQITASYEGSYCQALLEGHIPNVVQDTTRHPVTSQLNATKQFSIGAYIATPIHLKNGDLYGTLCCLNAQPDYSLNDRDLAFLRVFSSLITNILEQHLTKKTAQEKVETRISNVLNDGMVDMHFQPILDLSTNKICGFESLARFQSEPYQTPDKWFKEAQAIGLGEKLEMLAIRSALNHSIHLKSEQQYLSVNTSPEHVLSGALEEAIGDLPCHVLLEITEHSPITNYKAFHDAITPLRRKGVKVAIDDVGKGYSNFNHALELEPDIIKLDNCLTRSIHKDKKRRALASALCSFARDIDCEIIAEGIEQKEELETLKDLGIHKGQGYFIGRPAANPFGVFA